MSETKVAFAEGIKRSLKNVLHRSMQDFGYKYFTKCLISSQPWHPQKKLLDRLGTKDCQDFRLSVHSAQQVTKRKQKSQSWNRKRTLHLEVCLPYRKVCKPQPTREFFENVAISSRKSAAYTIKNEQDENICGKFYQKELIKVIQQLNHLQHSWSPMLLHNNFQTKHSFPPQNF